MIYTCTVDVVSDNVTWIVYTVSVCESRTGEVNRNEFPSD